MGAYGLFAIPTMAMKSEGHALSVIGNNIANITTGGYKRTDVRFSTVFSKSLYQQSDIGGVRPKEFQRITTQGVIQASDRKMDVSINGNGFFVLNTKLDGSGKTLYSRDGSFEMKTENPVSTTDSTGQTSATNTTYEGYLVDKNGYFVQGWSPNATTGLFSSSGALSSLRIDDATFASSSQASTAGTLVLNLPAGDKVAMPQTNIYNIDIIDSKGAHQSTALNFLKSGTNTWDMSWTTSQTPVAQVDTLTLSGTVEAGDKYTATVDGNPVTYTVQSTDTTLADVVSGLVAAINGNGTVAAKVTAAAGAATGTVTLTATAAGQSFTATGGVTNTATVAQVDTATIAGSVEVGDIYTLTINGNSVSYTTTGFEGSLAVVRSNFSAAINTDFTVGTLVTAATGVPAGDITLTAATAGTPFTSSISVTNGGSNPNSASIANTTANAGVNDGGNSQATTTANATNTLTSATQTLTFSGKGTLTSPTSAVSMPLSFAGGSTASFSLDISGLTQYAGDFQPTSYTRDGYAASNMRSFSFDGSGQIIATFEDNTFRPIYKLPLSIFPNADLMEMRNGNVFAETTQSGSATYVAADESGQGTFLPQTYEISNVDLNDQFTKLITTQKAYNAAATTLRTIDEMIKTAADLKR